MDGTRSALIVASDNYTDPGLRRLRAPASDARALAAVLRDPEIGGFEVRTLLNEPAHEINLAVEEFFADRRPGDLLLVHFSCHGVKDEDGELYFAASNTRLGRLGATAVAAAFVSRRMDRGRSRRVVLLLDCCYAGAFQRGLAARAGVDMGIKQQFGGRGRAVITASSAMEYAFEAGELAAAPEVAPSVFTGALVEGLATGEADRDQDGLVGLDELYDYVYDKVRVATPNQTPGKWIFGMEGELYLARRARPVTTPAPLPPALQQAIDSPLAGVRAGAVQELAHVLQGRHAGMALAARLTLEQLTNDDSRAVAAAAAAALGDPGPAAAAPEPAPPQLALPVTVIDFGRLPQHGQSLERRVQIGNAGGGSLNARAATSASWLNLRQTGDELVLAVDTSAPGEHEGTITIDSDGGSATIRVQARVDPAPQPAPGAAATARPQPVPEAPTAARPGPPPEPALTTASPAPVDAAVVDAAPAVAATAPAPAAGQVAAESAAGPAPPSDARGHRAVSQARKDRRAVAASGPGPGPSEKTPRPPRARRFRRAIRRRSVVIASGAVIAVIGLLTAIIASSGTTPPAGSGTTPPAGSGTTPTGSGTPPTAGSSTALTFHVRWTYTTGGHVESSPAVARGTIYVGNWDHKVYALDAATGHVRWTYTTGKLVDSSPAVAGGTVYIGSEDHKVYALNAATGHLRWTYTTADSVDSSPAVAGGMVYIGSNDWNVYALNAATGQFRWDYPTRDSVTSPAVADGTVYIASLDGNVYALNAATGHLRWAHTIGSPVFSSPVVANGTVYVANDNGKVYALNAATGHVRWTYTTGGCVDSNAAVAGGTVYIGSEDHKVYALNAATGHVRWTYTTAGSVDSNAAVAGGTVYIGSEDHKVYALDAATGHVRWTYTTGDIVNSGPIAVGGTVYIGSWDRKVYALDVGS